MCENRENTGRIIAILDKCGLSFRSLRHEFCSFEWTLGSIGPRIPDCIGILEH